MKRKLTLLAALLALTGLLAACTAGSSRPRGAVRLRIFGEPAGGERALPAGGTAGQLRRKRTGDGQDKPGHRRRPDRIPARDSARIPARGPPCESKHRGGGPDEGEIIRQGYDLTLYLEENLPPESWAYIKETELGQFTIGVLEEETVRAAVAAYPGETGRLTIGYQSASCSVARVEELDRAIPGDRLPGAHLRHGLAPSRRHCRGGGGGHLRLR